jgi:molybdenum cofactor cytidylyltransferase
VADALARHAVVVPVFQGVRGHPVGFSVACREALLALTGNRGASPVVQAQAALNAVGFVDVADEGTVTDIDTLQDLQRAEALLAQR